MWQAGSGQGELVRFFILVDSLLDLASTKRGLLLSQTVLAGQLNCMKGGRQHGPRNKPVSGTEYL